LTLPEMTPERAVELQRAYEEFKNDDIYCRESLTVQNKQGQLVPMYFGPAQRKLYAAIKKQRDAGKPVRIVYLKARQVWGTTYVAARFFRDTSNISGQNTFIVAQDDKTVANILSYYKRFATHYKKFRGLVDLPKITKNNTEGLEFTFDHGGKSQILAQTARNTTIGRSFSLRRVHFSEFAFYKDNAADTASLFGNVMAAVPDDADTEVIIESTADGLGDEFHRMWMRAQSRESDWAAVFFAWWEHPEYSRTLDIEADRFQYSLSEEEQAMRGLYGLTLEQLHWRRWKIKNDLNGSETLFKQEFPSNPEEAFLTSGRTRFDMRTIERMPVVRDAPEGNLHLEEFAGRKHIAFLPVERGALALYRRPQEGREYVIGADISEGKDSNEGRGEPNPDYTVHCVGDRDTGEQVARFRARVEPSEAGWQLYLLGVYFNWAGVVPERNGPGLAAIDGLLRHGYPPSLIYHRKRAMDQDPAERSDLIGFVTNQVTRPQIISHVDTALREASVLIHNPNTLQELRTFVIKPNGKAEHQAGCHDDEVFALALMIVGIIEMPRTVRQSLRREGAPTQVKSYLRKNENESRGRLVRMLR
jgi:hypothetical protein